MNISIPNVNISGAVPDGILQRFRMLFYTGCAISILLVLVLGILSIQSLDRQRYLGLSVGRSYQVLASTDSLQAHFHTTVVSTPGTAFQPAALLLDQRSEQQFLAQADGLISLVKDNPAEAACAKAIRKALPKLLNGEKIQLHTTNGSVKMLYTNPEQLRILTANLEALKKTARLTLQEKQAAYNFSGDQTKIAVTGGTILVLLIVPFLIYIILKELNIRKKAYLQEHELNQLKSNFLTLASHEFRTPLSSILLSAALIEKYTIHCDTESIAKHSLKIKQVVHNLESILEDFLSLEKLEAGKVSAIIQPFDLPALCREVLTEASMLAKTGQQLTYEQNGVGRIVYLDKQLVRSAINNLLFNAIKYAGENAEVHLTTTIYDSVNISVKDNGMGIADKDQENLCTMFYRVSDSGSIPGTGLGLAIVKRYVNLMNGKMRFYSKPQEETCFELVFPKAGAAGDHGTTINLPVWGAKKKKSGTAGLQ